jgi:hypothetical protein
MRFIRAILLTAIVAALATYAIDCSAMVSPEQAMQCCKTMPCAPHNHGKNCCQTMPSTHPPFVKSSSVDRIMLSEFSLAMLPVDASHVAISSPASVTVAHYHAPPFLDQASTLSPLRV